MFIEFHDICSTRFIHKILLKWEHISAFLGFRWITLYPTSTVIQRSFEEVDRLSDLGEPFET